MAITQARINLGAVVKRVHLYGEHVILEKDGYPVVAIMGIDEYEDYLDTQDEELKEQIRAGAKEFREGKGKPLDVLIKKMNIKYGV